MLVRYKSLTNERDVDLEDPVIDIPQSLHEFLVGGERHDIIIWIYKWEQKAELGFSLNDKGDYRNQSKAAICNYPTIPMTAEYRTVSIQRLGLGY